MSQSVKLVKKRRTKLGVLLIIGPAVAFIVEQIVAGAIGGQAVLSPVVTVINLLLLIIFVPALVFGILFLAKVL